MPTPRQILEDEYNIKKHVSALVETLPNPTPLDPAHQTLGMLSELIVINAGHVSVKFNRQMIAPWTVAARLDRSSATTDQVSIGVSTLVDFDPEKAMA